MASLVDTFDRADSSSSIGSPSDGGVAWVIQGTATWGIGTNMARMVSGSGEQWITRDASASDGDVYFTTQNAPADGGLCARVTDQNNGLLVVVNDVSNNLKLYKLVSGTYTQLGSTYSGAVANADVIKLTMSGSSLTVYQNGVSRITATDSAFSTNTKHGLRSFADTNARWDDWNFAAAGGGTTLTPGVDALTLTGFAPTVAQTTNQSLTPGVDALTLTGFAPTVAQTANVALTPGVDALTLTGFAPTVTQTTPVVLTPGTAVLTLGIYAPDLVQTGASAGGYGPAKKRYVVKVGNKLVVTTSAQAATRLVEAQSQKAKPETVSPDETIEPVNETAEIVEEVPIPEIRAIANIYQAQTELNPLFTQRNYEGVLALYNLLKQQQDEEDIELLLMAI